MGQEKRSTYLLPDFERRSKPCAIVFLHLFGELVHRTLVLTLWSLTSLLLVNSRFPREAIGRCVFVVANGWVSGLTHE